ncbi:unnamed protein product [Symbiodinium sp. CCMP2592]|nr:unnamed protein product [Symbiodinium sp. CCMP2592]
MPRPKNCAAPTHGPKRRKGSVRKIPCAYSKCSNKTVDCKNKGHTLDVGMLNKKVRHLHPGAVKARFCCRQHQELCRRKVRGPYGGREALNPEQIALLFHVLQQSTPWAAVLFLLSLMLGERVDAARRCQDSWFRGLDSDEGVLPAISIPKCNGKTRAREDVPLHAGFAALLFGWISEAPLRGDAGKQWPFPEQALRTTRTADGRQQQSNLLFPGRQLGGINKRDMRKPVSPKALWNCYSAAQKVLLEQRKQKHRIGEPHIFDDIALQRVTSHSCKKSAVTLLSDHTTTAIISAITATSPRILSSTYVCPTKKKQRKAVDSAFAGVLAQLEAPAEVPAPPETQDRVYCVGCGKHQACVEWDFCPNCGRAYVAVDSNPGAKT